MEQWNNNYAKLPYIYKRFEKYEEGHCCLADWFRVRYLIEMESIVSNKIFEKSFEEAKKILKKTPKKDLNKIVVERLEKNALKNGIPLLKYKHYERNKREALKRILNYILGNGNYNLVKNSKKCEITREELHFMEYLFDIFEKADKESKIIKYGKKYKTGLDVYEYFGVLNGVWDGLEILRESEWIEIKVSDVKEYWKDNYNWEDEKKELILEKNEVIGKLIDQKETLERMTEYLMKDIESNYEVIKELTEEFDGFLEKLFDRGISEMFFQYKEVLKEK